MKNLVLVFLLLLAYNAKAQYVTIPDTAFVTFLQNNYPACMSGNMMDTTCLDIVNEGLLDCEAKGISDLEGLQYFDNLFLLKAGNNLITNLPDLSQQSSCVNLSLWNNMLTSLSANQLPPNLLILDVSSNTSLTTIAPLPLTLYSFKAGNCPNLTVPFLHTGLELIDLQNSNLTSIPTLPNTVETLFLSNNPLTNIPLGSLPNSVKDLAIGNCNLSQLPVLPPNLDYLSCIQNNISSISNLPSSLTKLFASNNPSLTTVTNLPDSMVNVYLENCAISFIDSFPTFCSSALKLSNNNLTSIPNFPQNVFDIRLDNNNITTVPPFPSTLTIFSMENNNVSCWPVFPNLSSVQIQGNPFQCIPNYVIGMTVWTSLDTMPICDFGNATTNPQGCPTGEGIDGNLFEDLALDCHYAGTEAPIKNAQVKVYDVNGTLLETSSTGQSGRYFLSTSNNGIYSVEVDTLNKPFEVSCANVGADSLVTISAADSLVEDVNFGFVCKPGFDLGVQGAIPDGWVFPGQIHNLQVIAGDLSQWYGLNCAAGTGGNVSITVNGPVSYVNSPTNALVPTVSGSTYLYTITDFGNVSIDNSFSLNFQTDTTAQSGDTICVTVLVSPTTGDVDPANNTYTFCYTVVNSYDPNDKQVYPKTVEPGYDDLLTYTIRFQNTGTAPAFNIRLEDTLSGLLDYETFEVIGYKHANHYNLINDRLIVYFPNIMLPDSTSNFQESIGYFQYRIKPIAGLSEGTEIDNKAYIFFDFNPPIITNTATTYYQVNDLSTGDFINNINLQLFPNPSNGQVFLKSESDIKSVSVYNLMGQSITTSFNQTGSLTELNLANSAKGIYFIKIVTNNGTATRRFVID